MNIPYAKPEVTPGDIKAVTEVLQSDWLTNGPVLDNFEAQFAETVRSPFAVGVSSGTAGLHLAVRTLGVRPEQTVLVPSLTFAASANAVLYEGAKVEFVDIDPETLLLDVNQVEEKLAKDPRKYAGVIAVDFAGYPTDTRELSKVCRTYSSWLIEDAAHALGAVSNRHGEEVVVGNGVYADATVFSFHPVKHITTGEGGMVTTRDQLYHRTMRRLRSHSMDRTTAQSQEEGWYYRIGEVGFNYRLDEMSAALGSSQLKRLTGNIAIRQALAVNYIEGLNDTEAVLPNYDTSQTNAYHLFVVRVQNRQRVYNLLKERGIFAQVHYVPLHMQPAYQGFAVGNDLSHTESYYDECLSIPMYPTLTDSEQRYVIDTLSEIVG